MQPSSLSNRARWLMAAVVLVLVLGCGLADAAPTAQVVEATQIVPVTRVVEQIHIFPVTRIVQVTQVVPVREEPAQTEPAATEAPLATERPAPTTLPPLRNSEVLAWYNFEGDFPASGMVADVSGNGFHTQVVGSVGTDTGVSGQAAVFSGDGYLQAESNPAAGRTQISFSLWFRTDAPEDNYKLVSAAWWDGGPASGWVLATHAPEFWSDDTFGLFTQDYANHDNGFLPGEWMHEAITYNGRRIREYTNGVLVNDWEASGAAIGAGQPMVIGAWPPFSGYNFQGSLDEFKIYGRALSAQEVQDLYLQGQ